MKRVFACLGFAVSVIVFISGILVINGSYSGSFATQLDGAPSGYDSGYARFSTDYYTYSINNAAETTEAVVATAHNVEAATNTIENIVGILLICIGLISFCAFGIVYSEQPTQSRQPYNY